MLYESKAQTNAVYNGKDATTFFTARREHKLYVWVARLHCCIVTQYTFAVQLSTHNVRCYNVWILYYIVFVVFGMLQLGVVLAQILWHYMLAVAGPVSTWSKMTHTNCNDLVCIYNDIACSAIVNIKFMRTMNYHHSVFTVPQFNMKYFIFLCK